MTIDLAEQSGGGHSQSGEEGVIAAIFEALGVDVGYFVEFGAYDGVQLSNCRALYDRGWSGFMAEPDPGRYRDLRRNVDPARVATANCFIQPSGPDSLDALLSALPSPPPADFDFLSIDIDSFDLAIWRSVVGHRPKVVMIEFNPTIPSDTRYENPPGAMCGNSALSIFEHALSIGYELVSIVAFNLVFVSAEHNRGRFAVLPSVDQPATRGMRLFMGYDGSLIVSRSAGAEAEVPDVVDTPWGVVLAQPLPAWIRGYDSGSLARRLVRRAMPWLPVLAAHPLNGGRELVRTARREVSARRR